MFSPNCLPDYSHRSPKFRKLYGDLKKIIIDKLEVPNKFNILFISGSGTLANEIVLKSFRENFCFYDTENEFGNRLLKTSLNISQSQNIFKYNKSGKYNLAYVNYETSISKHNNIRLKKKEYGFVFSDAISAFPYYKDCYNDDVFTTVSSKILGSAPILSLIFYDKNKIEMFDDIGYSVLNFMRYVEFDKKKETPNTTNITGMEMLYNRMKKFDLKKVKDTINIRNYELNRFINNRYIIGNNPPVLTIKGFSNKALIIPYFLLEKYYLYKSGDNYQIFLYSGTDEQYKELITDLKKGILK